MESFSAEGTGWQVLRISGRQAGGWSITLTGRVWMHGDGR